MQKQGKKKPLRPPQKQEERPGHEEEMTLPVPQRLARPQPTQYKTHRMVSNIFDAAADDAGKVVERMRAKHFQA